MEQCDVFCLPSVRESGGSVVLEAMAAGKPVVVADHGGPAETVSNDVGFRVPATDPDELVRGIRRALQLLHRREEVRQRMGRAARKHVESRYTWSAKAGAAVALYEELMASPRRRAA